MSKLFLIIGLLGASFGINAEEKITDPLEITVHRSPTCSCCSKWIAHLKEHDFKVNDVVTTEILGIKAKYAVPKNMNSCHTAIIGGYAVEGHVPAQDIKKLLNLKPKVLGISVPGMPVGTPGMEMGNKKDAFQVISFDKDAQYKVFNSYEAK